MTVLTRSMISLCAACVCMLGAGSARAEEPQYELPRYKVVQKMGDFEIREYEPQLVAEVVMGGERCDAATRGFRALADFIFGENSKNTDMAMTAPVVQEQAPNTVAGRSLLPVNPQEDVWVVRFMMPSQYTMETLPKPEDPRVHIATIPGQRTASVTFTGLWTDSNLEEHVKALEDFVSKHGLKTSSKPIYAFYNDPFTWPWSRRNEIIVTLAPGQEVKTLPAAQ